MTINLTLCSHSTLVLINKPVKPTHNSPDILQGCKTSFKLSLQSVETWWVTELIELFSLYISILPPILRFALFRAAVINNTAECISTFHIHHMLRVNDAEFTWLDKQWEAREI